MRLLPCGPDAVLVETGSLAEVDAAMAAVVPLAEVRELVPAARTLLIRIDVRAGWNGVRTALGAARPVESAPSGRDITLPVRYDGADLALVAETADTDVAAVVEAHAGAVYTVAFHGFAPGFAYLVGLPASLRQPRLDRPRERVPAGSVGVADEFTGVYPQASPGGWRLLGHTDVVLFDPHRDPPALLRRGDRVRIEVL